MIHNDIDRFLEEHLTALRPLFVEARLAAWAASTTGDEAAVRRAASAHAELRKFYADSDAFARIRAWLRRDDLDPLTRRQLQLLDHQYTPNQLPAALIDEIEARAKEIEQVFYTYRAEVGGQSTTDNELRRLLEEEGDTSLRREAWEAGKAIGARVAGPLRALATRRNEAARRVGYPDYYVMQLELQEIRPVELGRITEALERGTDELFATTKAEIDAALGARFGLHPDALRPWHYADPFFQEPPATGDIDLDPLFRGRDVVEIARRYFAAIGLPVDAILARSDLHERPGKDQHAFCIDIDREGDVRILCNVHDNARWMGTLLHELGHAVYDVGTPDSLPFLLRMPAHTLTTEAVAMYFGALIRDAEWLRTMLDLPSARAEALAPALERSRSRNLLIFARWAMVMIRFEREFYRNPDRDDLNTLWWSLVARYQRLTPPPAAEARHDWATKIHFAVAPVYYHNYLLGELFAAQLRGTVERRGLTGPGLGDFLRDALFRPGAIYPWNELITRATGKPLSTTEFTRRTLAARLAA